MSFGISYEAVAGRDRGRKIRHGEQKRSVLVPLQMTDSPWP